LDGMQLDAILPLSKEEAITYMSWVKGLQSNKGAGHKMIALEGQLAPPENIALCLNAEGRGGLKREGAGFKKTSPP